MMSVRTGGAFLVIVAAAAVVTAGSPTLSDRMFAGEHRGLPITSADTVASHSYSQNDLEYYLTEEELGYSRPGLHIEIVGIEIPADRYPVVEVTFVDDFGLPLDREGRYTPGDISMSFVLAWYDGDVRYYTAYTAREVTSPITGMTATQATSDSGGSWQDPELGRGIYTFGTQLPEDYDMTRTHTVYVYGTRNTEELLGKNYYSDPWLDFRPDGGEITEQWAKTTTATCNTCHDPLALHGGRRRAIEGCVLCHQPQSTDPDTGNTVDLKVMAHKIHMGADLPSVQAGIPYIIIGFRGSVHDYSTVVFPQDVRNCWNCHDPDAAMGDAWYVYPGRDACGACHDDIDWETGESHPGGPQADDSACAACHQPQGLREFDPSVIGAHTIPTKSAQLPGLNMEIVDVTDAAPGSMPTVYFMLTNDDGSMVSDLASLRTLNLRAGGATGDTIDYTVDISQDARDATMSGDAYMKTFETPIPNDAVGTWTFSADVRRVTTIDDGSDEGLDVTEGAFNPIFYAAVTDDDPAPRRVIVDMEKCNACHDRLAFHGGQRFNVQECLICHRPNETDAGDRPPEEFPPESVHMKYMIHKIHTGHELHLEYTVYGFGSRPHNYNEVLYPGDRRNCEACHLPGTYGVPLPEGVLETETPYDWYTPMQPAAASCLPCHGSVDAAAHAFTNTAPFGESCGACHGDDRDYSVERVHAR
jgi:OmcA/MtrC family decaheme c-type cytochrome